MDTGEHFGKDLSSRVDIVQIGECRVEGHNFFGGGRFEYSDIVTLVSEEEGGR